MIVSIGVLSVLMSLAFRSSTEVMQATQRDSAQSYATSRARGAMDLVVRVLRNELVSFNVRAGTPLGINFSLDDGGNPLVRDAILFYFDSNRTAQLFPNGTAGFDDMDGDTLAGVMGIGMVIQDLNRDGIQDFIDIRPRDGVPDDLDRDGQPDRLWSLAMIRFNNIGQVNDPALWRNGRTLTSNVIVRRLVPANPITGPNSTIFRFSAHNPAAMLQDLAAFGGNANDIVDENELGNMVSADGIINATNEVASIDSITITLNVVDVTNEGLGREVVVSGDISSDLVTPRPIVLIRRNGIVGSLDPTLGTNVN